MKLFNREITEEYLLKHGFEIEMKMEKMIKENPPEEALWCDKPFRFYKNADGRITIQHCWTNRYGEGWSVHVDNQDYESVAWMDVMYINQLKKFIKIAYDN